MDFCYYPQYEMFFQCAALPTFIWIISLPVKPSMLQQVLMLFVAGWVSAGDIRLSVDSLNLLEAHFSHLNSMYGLNMLLRNKKPQESFWLYNATGLRLQKCRMCVNLFVWQSSIWVHHQAYFLFHHFRFIKGQWDNLRQSETKVNIFPKSA